MNLLKLNDVEIHPWSNLGVKGRLLDDSAILFYYTSEGKRKLYRAVLEGYHPVFQKVIKLPHIQDTIKTDFKFLWKGKELLVYEHKIFDHLIKIDETTYERRKDFIKTICQINAEAIKYNIICKDIHEHNIYDTKDGIKWVDLGSFFPLNIENANKSYISVCSFIFWFISHTYSVNNRDFNPNMYENSIKQIKNSFLKDTADLDFTKSESWLSLIKALDMVSNKTIHTEWTNYPDKMIALKDYKHNIKSKIIFETLSNMKDVKSLTDVGCHIGYYTFLTAPFVKSSVGIDIDESCINRAIKYSLDNNIKACFVNKGINQFVDNKGYIIERTKSDMVFAFAIIHHITKENKNITPKIFVDLLSKMSNKYIFIENITYKDFEEYKSLFIKNNFKLIKQFKIVPDERQMVLYKKV